MFYRKLMTILLLALFSFCMLPERTEAFNEKTVAVVFIDNTGKINKPIRKQFEDRVKRRFRFPFYEIMQEDELRTRLAGKLPVTRQERPSYDNERLLNIADTVNADVVVVVYTYKFSDEVVQSLWPWGETFRYTNVDLDVSIYRKTDNIFFYKKIKDYQKNNIAISTPALDIAMAKFSEAIDECIKIMPNIIEGEELINIGK